MDILADNVYVEQLLGQYETQIGDFVMVKNLSMGPYGAAIEPIMTRLRDENKTTPEFRKLIRFASESFGLPEILGTLPQEKKDIITGVGCEYCGTAFVPTELVMVDIPRAGTYVTECLMDKLYDILGPKFDIHKAVIDITRIEGAGNTLTHDLGRVKIRPINNDAMALISDPMNATGNTYVGVMKELMDGKNYLHDGAKLSKIVVAPLLSSVEGILNIANFANKYDINCEIISVGIDPELNDKNYIIDPGFGDAGNDVCGG